MEQGLRFELLLLLRSAELAGRSEYVEALRKALAFHDETRDWVACVRCSLAFPTNEAYSAHWTKEH